MNAIDALLIVIVLSSAWSGWSKGLVAASLQLLAFASSLWAAFLGYPLVVPWLETQLPTLGAWTAPLGFLAIYVLGHLVLGAVAGALTRAFPVRAHVHPANRSLGVIPGAANGLISATLLSLVFSMPLINGLSWLARESAIVGRLAAPADWLQAKLAPIFDPAVRRALTVVPPTADAIRLSFEVASPQVRTDLEARMLDLVNAERAKQGLQALKPDPELAEVARGHSRDMFARGYFSHVTPDGEDPFDRMRVAHVGYFIAGENLALAQTLPGAHQGLMNSPGHRANVLRPQFGRLGVGVLDGGRHGLMITQDFRN
jgi:uncharacterized protein YkwD